MDAAATEFGMRKIDIDGIHLRLNNQPIYLMGAMDPQDIPDKNIYLKPYHAPTDDEIRNEVVLAKKMGFNCIRKHHQIDDHRYLKWADRLGLLVYGQPPCYRRITDAAIGRFRHLIEGWVRRDRNHPSWIMWTLFNAAQGLQPMPTAYDKRAENESESKTPEEQAEMVKVAHDLVKRLDPTRPVMDTAGGEFFQSEVKSLMRYGYSGPQYYGRAREHYPSLRANRVARRPDAPLDPNPTPLIVGELGGYIYFPDMEKFKRQWDGQTPWPIVRSAGLGWGVLGEQMTAGYEDRFYRWGLDQVYGGFPEFAKSHDWFAFHDLKDEVEQVRKSPNVTGYLITMFSQIGPYSHGLLDYDMSPRPFAPELARLNNPDLVIIDWEELNLWSGDVFKAELILSHYGTAAIGDGTVEWRLEGFDIGGRIEGVSMNSVGVEAVGSISFDAPPVESGTRARLTAELDSGGRRLSSNCVDIYLYPSTHKRADRSRVLNVHDAAAEPLRAIGYDVRVGMDAKIPVTVATSFDEGVDQYLAAGGTVLLIVDDGDKLQPGLSLPIGEVGYVLGTMPGCNFWGYVNPDSGLFRAIPADNPMGWTYLKVLAAPPAGDALVSGAGGGKRTLVRMISGLDAAMREDVLVGCYSEWIRSRSGHGPTQEAVPGEVAGLIVQFGYKNGRIVVCTLDLLKPAVADPVATMMLHDLITYCHTGFEPKTRLPFSDEALIFGTNSA